MQLDVISLSDSIVLSQFVDNINQFVFWKDRDSIYRGCNLKFANSAGFSSVDQIIGISDFDMPWSQEEAEFFRKIDKEVMDTGLPKLNFEEPQTQSDGSIMWISTSKVPLKDAKNEVVGILGWYIDITPLKSMEIEINEKSKALLEYNKALEQSKAALERSNRDMEMFTYAVSHDLKSPIRTIVSFSDIILSKYKGALDHKVVELLNYISDSGKNMNHLVENILNFARTGLENTNLELVSSKSIINKKRKELDQFIIDNNANIYDNTCDYHISCYPDLLGLVFYNLISNGIKYNESDSPTINISCEDLTTEIIFTIEDNGIGIEQKFADKIFEPFKRLHSSNIEGSGLGLSICRRIVELHGGRIWIEKNQSGGSIFKFSIQKSIS